MPKFKDLTGKTFGRLTVINRTDDYVSPSGHHKTRWVCKCTCGNVASVTGADLVRGDTKSCGCFEIESKRKNATTHGLSKEPLHTTWSGIKARCYNPNHKNYDRYGGRGICMCDEWKNSYESFHQWAMQNGYAAGLTVDRINNDLGYSPDNCRIVDRTAQANNRGSNIMIAHNGECHNIKWWADHSDVLYSTLYYRIKSGWSIEKALAK